MTLSQYSIQMYRSSNLVRLPRGLPILRRFYAIPTLNTNAQTYLLTVNHNALD